MDSGSIKSRPGLTPRSQTLRDPVSVREATETELGPKAVAPPSDGGTRNSDNRPRDDAFAREPIIDPKSGEALLRAAEERPEQTQPSSNQAMMRQRAYGGMARQEQPSGALALAGQNAHADVEA
jgi:hypothetical protein